MTLVVEFQGETFLTAAVAALIQSEGQVVNTRVARDGETRFTPRLEDDDSGGWAALLLEGHDALLAARAIADGARAIVIPSMSLSAFGDALSALKGGKGAYVPAETLKAMASLAYRKPESDHPVRLSQREQQVLLFVGQGRSNTEIAAQMGISSNTVRTHIRTLCGKLKIFNRADLAVVARGMSEQATGEPRGHQP